MTICSHGLRIMRHPFRVSHRARRRQSLTLRLLFPENIRSNMVCIYCNHETEVYNSRERKRNPSVWRRRRCIACVAQFSTNELPDYATSLVVSGQNKTVYPFSRDRLFLSLYKSLGHRKDALTSATELTQTVIGKLLRDCVARDGVISMRELTVQAYRILKRYDPLAATTYKAYHQSHLSKK